MDNPFSSTETVDILNRMNLLLSSFPLSTPRQDKAIAALVGKPINEIKIAYIENAYDVYNDESSLIEGREALRAKGWDVELVDLREWKNPEHREFCVRTSPAKICSCLQAATRSICDGS